MYTGRTPILALAAIFLGVAVAGDAAYTLGTKDKITFTVKDKDRITEVHHDEDDDGNDTTTISSKYIVFTDKETFENTDSWLNLKFNSSDVQGSLEPGKTYTCDVYGKRIPFLSMYRNIVSCTPGQK
jgi:hypothetical protein